MGFGVVNIFLIKLLFGNKGKCIKDAQPVEGQAEELCQLSQGKQGVAVLYNIFSWDAVDLILGRLCQCYDNAALDRWLRQIASKIKLVVRYRPSTVGHRLSKLLESFAVVGRWGGLLGASFSFINPRIGPLNLWSTGIPRTNIFLRSKLC